MMMSRFAAAGFASILAAFSAAACGGNSTPSLTNACADYSKALCQKLSTCQPLGLASEFPDEGSCETTFRSECSIAVNEKGVNFTPTFLEGCTSAMNALSCDDYNYGKTPSACTTPAGTLPDNAACSSPIECKGSVCNGASATACGTCATKAAGTCTEDTDCPGAQVCSYGVAGTGACVTLAGVGATCDQSTRCARSLYCTGDASGGSGTCTALPTEGQPCTTSCASGLFCNGTCLAPKLVAVGAACNAGDPTMPLAFCKASSCVNSLCVAFGAEGAACGANSNPSCAPALTCVGSKCVSDTALVCN